MVKVIKSQKRHNRTLKKKKGGGIALSRFKNSKLDIKSPTNKDKCEFIKLDFGVDNGPYFRDYLKRLFELNPGLIDNFIDKMDVELIIEFYEWMNSNFYNTEIQHVNDIKKMIECTFREEIENKLIKPHLHRKISDY